MGKELQPEGVQLDTFMMEPCQQFAFVDSSDAN